jgi:hypothetical protein
MSLFGANTCVRWISLIYSATFPILLTLPCFSQMHSRKYILYTHLCVIRVWARDICEQWVISSFILPSPNACVAGDENEFTILECLMDSSCLFIMSYLYAYPLFSLVKFSSKCYTAAANWSFLGFLVTIMLNFMFLLLLPPSTLPTIIIHTVNGIIYSHCTSYANLLLSLCWVLSFNTLKALSAYVLCKHLHLLSLSRKSC